MLLQTRRFCALRYLDETLASAQLAHLSALEALHPAGASEGPSVVPSAASARMMSPELDSSARAQTVLAQISAQIGRRHEAAEVAQRAGS